MELKDFIKQYKSEINALNFKEVYYQASQGLKNRGKLTELFYKVGVDPLRYLKVIPANYANASTLRTMRIPNGVTHIGKDAFHHCYDLTSVTIPSSVAFIGDSAFWNCKKLKNITYTGTIADWNNIDKDYDWDRNIPTNCLIRCTDGSIDKE